MKQKSRGWKIFSSLETDLISGDGGWEVGALVLLGMKRFDSVKRGNGVGREPIKYQPILV